ncbi:class F sortase [Streptomyces sp. NPDC005407]|uniref:class F sortase n=1 Tax=Streptomyces sp. NPDC005407 TaxID=3155340 RepID=UPI0033BBF2CD
MSRTHHRARWTGALVALACIAPAGCSAGAVETAVDSASRAPSRTASASTAPGEPAQVAIPSIGVASSLMRLGLNKDGTVQVPPADKGMTAGWYTGGAVPGERGAAVIIGHNDTRFGKAVFHDLKKITKGADIAVRSTRGTTAHFTVTGTETVSKSAFPTEKVYGATGERALRLVTCSGDFDDQGHPVDNLIVYATLR